MWLDYSKERWGYDSIECDFGFALFEIKGEDLLIQDVYVKPELRGDKKAVSLMDRVMKEGNLRKCNRAIIQIWTSDKGATRTMDCVIGYGFKIAEASNNRILLVKEI